MTISILSRVYLSCFETGAEQERVFSSSKHAMERDQTRMSFEMLKMRTLLSHNKQLISAGVSSAFMTRVQNIQLRVIYLVNIFTFTEYFK